MRSPEQLLKEYELASKERPILIASNEYENFIKAMRILGKSQDERIGRNPLKITLQDRDVLLKDGVISPLDGKTAFHNRRDWADHLKRNDCVEIGNDFNNAKPRTEIRGDFDCRKELSQATHQIMEKYGH